MSISALPSLTELRFLAEYACSFVFLFPETDPHILSVFQASWKDKKTCVEADALGLRSGPNTNTKHNTHFPTNTALVAIHFHTLTILKTPKISVL